MQADRVVLAKDERVAAPLVEHVLAAGGGASAADPGRAAVAVDDADRDRVARRDPDRKLAELAAPLFVDERPLGRADAPNSPALFPDLDSGAGLDRETEAGPTGDRDRAAVGFARRVGKAREPPIEGGLAELWL